VLCSQWLRSHLILVVLAPSFSPSSHLPVFPLQPFECPVCDYRAARKEHLTRHARKHTAEYMESAAQKLVTECRACTSGAHKAHTCGKARPPESSLYRRLPNSVVMTGNGPAVGFAMPPMMAGHHAMMMHQPMGQPMGQPMSQMGQPMGQMGQMGQPMGQPMGQMGQPMSQMGQAMTQMGQSMSHLGHPMAFGGGHPMMGMPMGHGMSLADSHGASLHGPPSLMGSNGEHMNPGMYHHMPPGMAHMFMAPPPNGPGGVPPIPAPSASTAGSSIPLASMVDASQA
jgi:hypothetical protein